MRDGVMYVICSRCGEVPLSGFDGPVVALLWHWRNKHGAIPEAAEVA